VKLELAALVLGCAAACVPAGNSTRDDEAGSTAATAAPTFRPSFNVMNGPFEDDFERTPSDAAVMPHIAMMPTPMPSASGSGIRLVPPPVASAGGLGDELGPNWRQAETAAWHIENGRLCGQRAANHGVWLNRTLPINARIEFDAIAETAQGDLKAEVWGDGQSHATKTTYDNATSYVVVLGGWKNQFHVLARENEHAPDRREIRVDQQSDDPREKPVFAGQIYHFRIERTDGHTIRWSVNGLDYLSWDDPQPLVGFGHDHFGFNDWEAKVCFDNVKVTPLP
jgi:hypothetical protein